MLASVQTTAFTEDGFITRLRLVNATIDIKIRVSYDSRLIHIGGVYGVGNIADLDGWLPMLAPFGTLLSLDKV